MAEVKESPLIERAKKDGAKDRSLADEARDSGDIASLHALCVRLLADRADLAKAFDAVIAGWSLLRDGNTSTAASSTPDRESVAAIQQVANEAIGLARDVVKAFTAAHTAKG